MLHPIGDNKRDSRITFDEEPHIYYVDGNPYEISVTSFIHQFFEEFNADKIIEKFYDMWQTNPNSPYFGLTPEEIKEAWRLNGKRASELGTQLHKDIEQYYNGEEVNNDTLEFKHFLEFYKDHSHLIPLRQEWMVFDEELELAGSIDAIFKDGDDIVIVDWKRSKAIKEQSPDCGRYPLTHLPNANFWHYSLQLNIYKAILEKHYDLEIGSLRLAIFHPNQDTYQLIKVPNLQEEVNILFDLRKKELEILKSP